MKAAAWALALQVIFLFSIAGVLPGLIICRTRQIGCSHLRSTYIPRLLFWFFRMPPEWLAKTIALSRHTECYGSKNDAHRVAL